MPPIHVVTLAYLPTGVFLSRAMTSGTLETADADSSKAPMNR